MFSRSLKNKSLNEIQALHHPHLLALILKEFYRVQHVLGKETSRNHQAYRRGHLDVAIW